MRLSLPYPHALRTSALLATICSVLSCTPQQVVIEKPCPPVEYPVVHAPTTTPTPDEAAVPRTLEVRLSPTRNETGNVIAVDVAMRYSVPPVDFGSAEPLILRLDPHVAGEATGDRIDDLAARDSEGSLALRRVTGSDKDKPQRAEWKAERRPRGPVTITYRVQLLADDAAHDEIIASAGGVVGLGRALFLMPDTTESHSIRVIWDLQGLGAGAQGTSSFGMDMSDVEGAPTLLENTIWAAGSLGEITIRSTETNGSGTRFRIVSLGQTSLDVTDVGPWLNRTWLAARPLATKAAEFDLFLRSSGKAGSRLELDVFGSGAMASLDNEVKFAWPEKLRLTESVVRSVRGTEVMNQRWFDRGFGTYLALDALRKSGLAAPTDIASEITKRADRYFLSAWLRTPLAALSSQKDELALTQIDDRGFLMAAELDAKIRANSVGKRSLVEFIRALEPVNPTPTDSADLPKTTGITESVFSQALDKELGVVAVARYRAVVESASGLSDVPDDAFGPCFKKVKKKVQREDPTTKKRESVDGFTFAVVPKLPASCANVAPVAAAPKKP